MSPSAVAPRHVDHAAPGRVRRLILTILGPVFLLTVSLALIGLYGDRLPDHVRFAGRSVGAENGFTWLGASFSQALWMTVWIEALCVLPFLYYWRLPRVQRVLVAMSFAVGLHAPVSGLLLASATSSAARPVWHMAVEAVVLAAGFALGWVAAGPLPRLPEVTAAPPPHAPAMALRPRQRVLFTTSSWSSRTLLTAAAIAAAGAVILPWGGFEWRSVLVFAGWTVFVAAQARTRLQIDASGVTLRVPWVPFLSRTVPYTLIRFAEARNEPPRYRDNGPAKGKAGAPGSEPPPGRYGLGDGVEGWGAVSGKGPVLALSLADDRWFVYSTREAQEAAALVNGWLHRQRQAETA